MAAMAAVQAQAQGEEHQVRVVAGALGQLFGQRPQSRPVGVQLVKGHVHRGQYAKQRGGGGVAAVGMRHLAALQACRRKRSCAKPAYSSLEGEVSA